MSKPTANRPSKPHLSQPSPQAKALRALGERYIETTVERFPSLGSAVGRHELDAELEIPSEKLLRAQQKLVEKTLAEVEAIPEHDLRGDDWLDRRALLAELRTETWSYERETFRRNPESWVSGALNSVHHLVMRNADDLGPAAEDIASRLAKLPDYLEGAAELLKRPVPLIEVTRPVSTAYSAAAWLRCPELLPGKCEEVNMSDAGSRFEALVNTPKLSVGTWVRASSHTLAWVNEPPATMLCEPFNHVSWFSINFVDASRARFGP